MSSKKTYNGSLNIGEKNVMLDSDINYQVIEIQYTGNMTISNLLPKEYLVKLGNGKIIIAKLNINDTVEKDLFNYRGRANITRCTLVDINNNKYNILPNKTALLMWEKLSNTLKVGTTSGVEKDWAYLSLNWEDIQFDGNNDKRLYTYRQEIYDKETKQYTYIEETRKK